MLSPVTIVFIVAYLLVLCCYFITETSGKMYLRAPNKIVLASMFLVFGAWHFSTQYDFLSYHLLLMVALFLAWLGDVFLLFDLNRGGDFFLCGNVCFVVYLMALLTEKAQGFASFWWVIIAEVLIVGALIVCAQKLPKVFKFGKMKWPMMLYLSSITLHGLMGIAVMIALPGTPFALIGLGSLLFMISDYVLTVDKFVITKNPWILRANSAFYFTGLLIVVLGMAIAGGGA